MISRGAGSKQYVCRCKRQAAYNCKRWQVAATWSCRRQTQLLSSGEGGKAIAVRMCWRQPSCAGSKQWINGGAKCALGGPKGVGGEQ